MKTISSSIKKLWVLIGLATGTRGQEQHLLEVKNIEKDVCGPEHPKHGMVFYKLVGLNHKRGKLTTTSVYVDNDDAMKMLLWCNKKMEYVQLHASNGTWRNSLQDSCDSIVASKKTTRLVAISR